QIPYIYILSSKGRCGNGIVRTDLWLEEDFNEPVKMCEKLTGPFNDDNPQKIYEYLADFGMYTPARFSRHNFLELKKKNAWDLAKKIHVKYRRMWAGPDCDIYIFP